jgi:hypothetical protein
VARRRSSNRVVTSKGRCTADAAPCPGAVRASPCTLRPSQRAARRWRERFAQVTFQSRRARVSARCRTSACSTASSRPGALAIPIQTCRHFRFDPATSPNRGPPPRWRFRARALHRLRRKRAGKRQVDAGGGSSSWHIEDPDPVESRCGAVALGSVCLLPPLSSGGARVTSP